MESQNQNFFEDADVISTYSDTHAVEDGILVAVNDKDRVSRSVWEFLVAKAPKGAEPPNRWPVEMMGWFRAGAIKKQDALRLIADLGAVEAQKKLERMTADNKALALSRGIITTHARAAKRVYDENTGGGIYKMFTLVKGEIISSLQADQPPMSPTGGFVDNYSILWLLPNENGGTTLMFPEDY